jgi:Flp pilus assembly protein TadG
MMSRCDPHGAVRHQRGLAMVEFAISVPVILLLMFGSFEFGHLMIEYSALNDGVRNAARYVAGAVLQGTADTMVTGSPGWTDLVRQGQNLAVFGNIGGTGSAILPGLTTGRVSVNEDTLNRNITVIANYPYVSLFGGAIPTFTGGSISTAYTLTISTTMRAL